MKWLHEGKTLDEVFEQVAQAKSRVLITDYDGTLAPFVFDRNRAYPYQDVLEMIVKIAHAERSRVFIISGRSLKNLNSLLKIDAPVELWGTHGWERQKVNGECTIWPVSKEHQRGMDKLIEWADQNGLRKHIEIKPASVAVHWRGTDSSLRARLQHDSKEMMESLADKFDLTLHEFDGGRELRVPGRDKGAAVESILKDTNNGSFIVYFGDDRTDEDGFHAIGDHGLKVLVRNEVRDTEADLWLRPPRELHRFLERWYEALSRND